MATQSSRSSIQRKILVRALAISVVPVLIIGGAALLIFQSLASSADASVTDSRAQLTDEVVGAGLGDTAEQIGEELNQFLGERISDAQVWASTPVIVDAARAGSVTSAADGLVGQGVEELDARFASQGNTLGVAPEADSFLNSQLEQATDFFEVFITEENGLNVALTNETSDFVQRDEGWWTSAWDTGLDIGAVEFDDSAGVFSVDVSVRIDDPATGQPLGVMKAVLGVSLVQDIADRFAERAGGDVSVLNENGLLLAETSTGHLAARIMTEAPLDVADGLNPTYPGLVAGTGQSSGYLVTDADVLGYAATADTAQAGDETFAWMVIVEESIAQAFAPLAGLEQLSSDLDSSSRNLGVGLVLLLLAAVALALGVSYLLSRAIVTPLIRLRDAAHEVSDVELPQIVESIGSLGPDDELPTLPPISVPTGDEIEEVADAFNAIQDTAVRLAGEQADSRRRNVAAAFVNMGRRNQSLLRRQLRQIEDLERNETDQETLSQIFEIDHLATRMRRNAESLLVLAGEEPARRWSQPVDVSEVVRSAASEIEQFDRVSMTALEPGQMAGSVVSEVAHLLAELIENALLYSPPTTLVTVVGRDRANGYTISIVDQGIGMTEDEIEEANHRLASPADFDQAPTRTLGLFVVGRLAARHGINVRLVESPTDGITAKVTLPKSLTDPSVAPAATEAPEQVAASAEAPSIEEPEPVAHQPEPVAHQPEPVAHQPEPVAHQPERAPAHARTDQAVPPAAADSADDPMFGRQLEWANRHMAGEPAGAADPAPAPVGPAAEAPQQRRPIVEAMPTAPVAQPVPPQPAAAPAPEPTPPAAEDTTPSGFRIRRKPEPVAQAPVAEAPTEPERPRDAVAVLNTLDNFLGGVRNAQATVDRSNVNNDPEANR